VALYHLKPSSRSLFIEYLGADQLPYVWIGTALIMTLLISAYHRLVERCRRVTLVLGTCLFVTVSLIIFRILLNSPGPVVAATFYIFVDIPGEVLIEQLWSLTNSIDSTKDGKSCGGRQKSSHLCPISCVTRSRHTGGIWAIPINPAL